MENNNIDEGNEPCNSGLQSDKGWVMASLYHDSFRRFKSASSEAADTAFIAEVVDCTKDLDTVKAADDGFSQRVRYACYVAEAYVAADFAQAAYNTAFFAAYEDWPRLQEIVPKRKSNDPSKQYGLFKVVCSRPFVEPKNQRADDDLDKAVTLHVEPHSKINGKASSGGSKKNRSHKKNKK